MAEHTPGPWTIGTDRNGLIAILEPDKLGGYPITHVVNTGSRQVVGEANARLIAATPELLEALRDMLNQFKGVENTDNSLETAGREIVALYKARAAIARATKTGVEEK